MSTIALRVHVTKAYIDLVFALIQLQHIIQAAVRFFQIPGGM
jgi:hypothetical protein